MDADLEDAVHWLWDETRAGQASRDVARACEALGALLTRRFQIEEMTHIVPLPVVETEGYRESIRHAAAMLIELVGRSGEAEPERRRLAEILLLNSQFCEEDGVLALEDLARALLDGLPRRGQRCGRA